MHEPKRSRGWLLSLPVMASVVAFAWMSRGHVNHWAHRRLSDDIQNRLAALPEKQAAEAVRQLTELDSQAPAVLVPLLADRRRPIVESAAESLHRLITDWQRLPPDQSAPRLAALAQELARIAPELDANERSVARALATRVLSGSLHGQGDHAADVLADCEAVLRLPVADEGELRIAAVPALPNLQPAEPQQAVLANPSLPQGPQAPVEIVAPLPVPSPQPAPSAAPPFYGRPREPERLIDASRERPEEPRQLRRPKALKLEG